jgi:transcriptional regulator GlxA family with amidase domain
MTEIQATTTSSARPPRTIGIFLFDDMEELDAVGPWEVFAWWTNHFSQDGFLATTFSHDGAPVRCEKSLVVHPHQSRATLPPLEVLLHPGGDGNDRLSSDHEHLEWLRLESTRVPILASVCTGALTLASAGLLHGRPATTNRTALAALADRDPSIEVRPEDRYVDDGNVITSAGISAGIDMALHIVGRLVSPERSEQVRHGIEYTPGDR